MRKIFVKIRNLMQPFTKEICKARIIPFKEIKKSFEKNTI